MKRSMMVLLSCLCVVSDAVADKKVKYQNFSQPTEVRGLIVRGRVAYYPNDTLMYAQVAKETVLFGHVFPEGTGFHFRDDGTLEWCFLAQDSRVEGHLLRGGGNEWMTEFYPSGKLKSGGLAEVQIIDGIPCAVGTFWSEVFGGGGRTHFYESGKLQYAKVAQTVQYRGATIKKMLRDAPK